jgi:hypothetical protein
VPAVLHITFNSTSVIISHIAGDSEPEPGVFLIMAAASLIVSAGFILALASGRPKPQAIAVYDYNNINYTDDDDQTPPFVG